MLAYNPFLASAVLNGCALDDTAGAVLAEVVRRSHSLSSLSVERNDLREPGLLGLVEALRDNGTLKVMEGLPVRKGCPCRKAAHAGKAHVQSQLAITLRALFLGNKTD